MIRLLRSDFTFGLLSAVFALLILSSASHAGVIITEIMYNADGSDGGREWVEIYNNGASAVDISGWDVVDEDTVIGAGPIPAATSLAAGEVLVLIEDQTVFEGDWGTGINFLVLPGMGTDLNLANSPGAGNEVLMLRDSSDLVIDTVDYDDEGDWPEDTGESVYLLPGNFTAALNDDGLNWGKSTLGVHGAFTGDGDASSPTGHVGSPGSLVAVPEPNSIVLVGFAGLLLAGRCRRKA